MDRTLEVLEGNVDRLLVKHSALISERNALQASVDELQHRTGQLEAGLAAARSEVARLEGLLGQESSRNRRAADEIGFLIERLAGREEPAPTPVREEAPVLSRPAVPPEPASLPVAEKNLPAAEKTLPVGDHSLEAAVTGLRTIALDREHATAASGINKRLF